MSDARLRLAARLSEFTDSDAPFPLTLRGWYQYGDSFDGPWRSCPVRSEFTLKISNLAALQYVLTVDPDIRLGDANQPFLIGKRAICSDGAMDTSVLNDSLVEFENYGALSKQLYWAFPGAYRWQTCELTQGLTLLEALANAGPSAEIEESSQLIKIRSGRIRGKSVTVLDEGRLSYSETETSTKTVMVLDKTRDYLLLNVTEYNYDFKERKDVGVSSFTEVKRAHELASSLWLPAEVEHTHFDLATGAVRYRYYLCYESVVEDGSPHDYKLDHPPEAHFRDNRRARRY